jgi:hypothetical protein
MTAINGDNNENELPDVRVNTSNEEARHKHSIPPPENDTGNDSQLKSAKMTESRKEEIMTPSDGNDTQPVSLGIGTEAKKKKKKSKSKKGKGAVRGPRGCWSFL